MYFSYGFPKSYCLGNGDALPSTVVYTSFGGDLLVVVTSTSLQVWSGGQQRLKLGEVVRDEHVTKEEGCITCACWCPSRRVIAVAVGSLAPCPRLLSISVPGFIPGLHFRTHNNRNPYRSCHLYRRSSATCIFMAFWSRKRCCGSAPMAQRRGACQSTSKIACRCTALRQ